MTLNARLRVITVLCSRFTDLGLKKYTHTHTHIDDVSWPIYHRRRRPSRGDDDDDDTLLYMRRAFRNSASTPPDEYYIIIYNTQYLSMYRYYIFLLL